MTRDDIEKNLEFVGFVVISCPLKPDSKVVMKEIINSLHHVCLYFITYSMFSDFIIIYELI
jgi:cation-transporting ATPase 13A1